MGGNRKVKMGMSSSHNFQPQPACLKHNLKEIKVGVYLCLLCGQKFKAKKDKK
jgi:hypothetical protein